MQQTRREKGDQSKKTVLTSTPEVMTGTNCILAVTINNAPRERGGLCLPNAAAHVRYSPKLLPTIVTLKRKKAERVIDALVLLAIEKVDYIDWSYWRNLNTNCVSTFLQTEQFGPV